MITLTDKAAQHVSRYLARRGKGVGLRVGVKTTGEKKRQKNNR